MLKRNAITAAVVAIALGIGATAYASAGETKQSNTTRQRLGLGRITSMRGYDYSTNVLKNKLGLSDKDITDALNSGKSPYEVALEKGMTEESFKQALLEERSKAIDAAVAKGSISKEDGENLKANLNDNLQNCTGSFGQGNGQGRACGTGMMGNGQGNGCGAGMMGNGQGRGGR